MSENPVPPRHLARSEYLARGRAAAERVARANGASRVTIAFPDADSMAPVRIAVTVRETIEVRRNEEERRLRVTAEAEAELAPPGADGLAPFAAGGEYDGPLAFRQGNRCGLTWRSHSTGWSARHERTESSS
jgi:hypothetical protein